MNKKTVLFFALPIAFGGAYMAMAQEDTTITSPTPTVVSEPVTVIAPVPPMEVTQPTNIATPPQQEEKQMILEVGPEGKVLLRGIIDSVSAGVITVKGWGGVWTVNVPVTAQILPEAVRKDITKFKVGDYVGVQGRVINSASWTINAYLVRDRTRETIVPLKQEQKSQKGEMKKDFSPGNGELNQEKPKRNQETVDFKPTVLPQKIQGIFSNLKERIGQFMKPQQATQVVPTTESSATAVSAPITPSVQ